jgi:hypothetical protein
MDPFGTGRATNVDPSVVHTRDDFAGFVSAVLEDYRLSGVTEWENGHLEGFLDGLAAFASARVVDRSGQDEASWRLFAELLHTATGYE